MQFLLPASILLSSLAGPAMGQSVTLYEAASCDSLDGSVTDYTSCGVCKSTGYPVLSVKLTDSTGASGVSTYSDDFCGSEIEEITSQGSCSETAETIGSYMFVC
jgi:hypothetical protein